VLRSVRYEDSWYFICSRCARYTRSPSVRLVPTQAGVSLTRAVAIASDQPRVLTCMYEVQGSREATVPARNFCVCVKVLHGPAVPTVRSNKQFTIVFASVLACNLDVWCLIKLRIHPNLATVNLGGKPYPGMSGSSQRMLCRAQITQWDFGAQVVDRPAHHIRPTQSEGTVGELSAHHRGMDGSLDNCSVDPKWKARMALHGVP